MDYQEFLSQYSQLKSRLRQSDGEEREAIKAELKMLLYPRCIFCGKRFRIPVDFRKESHMMVACVQCDIAHQKDRKKVAFHKGRARAVGTAATLTVTEWYEILAHYEERCAYCGGQYENMDHVIPLDKGGGTTAGNVVPACQSCNNRKGSEFLYRFNGRLVM